MGILFHMGVVRSIRWARLRTGLGSKLELIENTSSPRLLLSSLMQFGLLYMGSISFEALYSNVPIVPRVIEGAVWCMRRVVGLSGTAPYKELTGGGDVANVLMSALELERVLTCVVPRTFGTLGFNVMPLSSEQVADVFTQSGVGGSELPGRFLTPSRLLRMAFQMGCGAGLVGLIRSFIIPRVLGVPQGPRQHFNPSPCLAAISSILSALAIVRDAETISFLGTRFRMNLLGVTVVMLVPNALLFEFLVSLFRNTVPRYDLTEENTPEVAEQLANDLFGWIPLRFMSPHDADLIHRVLLGVYTSAMYLGDTEAFAGSLATFTTFVVMRNVIQAEPLSTYEESLERINAEIDDAVFERQMSVESVANDALETCPICLRAERPESQDMLRIRTCKHEFHTECLASWMQQSTDCPLCRAPVERKLSQRDQDRLHKWNGMSYGEKEVAIWHHSASGARAVLDALTVGPINNNRPTASLNMITVAELVSVLDSNILSSTPLIDLMCEVVQELQKENTYPVMSMVEDFLTVIIAPTVPEPLFSGAFQRRKNLMALAPSEPSIIFKLMFWIHFHF